MAYVVMAYIVMTQANGGDKLPTCERIHLDICSTDPLITAQFLYMIMVYTLMAYVAMDSLIAAPFICIYSYGLYSYGLKNPRLS